MQLSDITIESIKRTSIQDGDIVVVTLPLNPQVMEPVRFRFLNTVNNEFERVIKKLGYNCEVVVMELEQDLQIEVLTKEEFEKKKGRSGMYNWISKKWDWYKALPWYWKFLAAILGFGILVLLVLSLIGGSKPAISDVSAKAHNDMVDGLIEEKVETDKELVAEIEKSKEKIDEITKEEKLVDEEADKVKEAISNASTAEEVREILKGLE